MTVYKYVKWLITILKKYHPAKKIIVGGSVATSIPHIILEKTESDIVCIGEGEDTIVELIDSIESNKPIESVKGIWFRGQDNKIYRNGPRESIKDLDIIPLPSWALFPMDIYLKNPVGAPNRNKWIDGNIDDNNVLTMNVVATRGCPYKCTYCYHDFMGRGYRHRSPQDIVKEIRILNERYGVEYIQFMDDEFCLKKSFVYDFCKEIKAEFNRRITWGCSGRVNLMTEDLIATMRDAGCVLIGYGIESGSQRMLDVIKKGVTVEQSKEAVRLTKKYLGWADCSFMIGAPGENEDTIQETIDFCKELDLTPEVIFFMTPYPGTELYQSAVRQGKIIDEEQYMLNLGEQGEKIKVNFTDMSDEELYEIQTEMIAELGAWNKLKHQEAR
ncbi:MAG: radical SAM protein [Planctomycetes bacterium]|nr:radical SAM protein [Planctomycetota bacterium]